jgi:multidrug resistance protein
MMLFFICFLGFLSSLDEIIYLPALPVMVKDFHTTQTLGLLTISIYLFAMAISSLIWGVLSDYYGRKPITIFGIGAFILSTVGCYFSPNIYMFLVFRGLQGCSVSETLVVAQATIADIYQPNDRGSAYGILYAFFFSAGLLGPTIGGQLSYYYGWRSTFILVTIISLVLFISYVLLVPETQQYKVICRYKNQQKITLLESDQVFEPKLTNPCLPLLYLMDSTIIPYAFVLIFGFIGATCALTLISTETTKPPYSYHADTIGLLFIPVATSYLLGSVIGGKLSDLVAIKFFQDSKILEGRILPGLLFSVLTSVGLVIYGWAFQYGVNIIVPILGQVICGFGQSAMRPGILSYITIKRQDHAAGISSAINCVQILLTSILFTFAAKIVQLINDGPFFTSLAVCNLSTTIIAAVIFCKKLRLSQNPEKKMLL